MAADNIMRKELQYKTQTPREWCSLKCVNIMYSLSTEGITLSYSFFIVFNDEQRRGRNHDGWKLDALQGPNALKLISFKVPHCKWYVSNWTWHTTLSPTQQLNDQIMINIWKRVIHIMIKDIGDAFVQKCTNQMNYSQAINHLIIYITFRSTASMSLRWRQLDLALIVIYLIIAVPG